MKRKEGRLPSFFTSVLIANNDPSTLGKVIFFKFPFTEANGPRQGHFSVAHHHHRHVRV